MQDWHICFRRNTSLSHALGTSLKKKNTETLEKNHITNTCRFPLKKITKDKRVKIQNIFMILLPHWSTCDFFKSKLVKDKKNTVNKKQTPQQYVCLIEMEKHFGKTVYPSSSTQMFFTLSAANQEKCFIYPCLHVLLRSQSRMH